MSDINLFSLNYATLPETEVTTDSLDEFFPPSNIKDDRSTKVYRSQEGTTTASVIFDLKNIVL